MSPYAALSQKCICRDLRAFSENKCPLFTRLGGGSPKGDNVTFFYRFCLYQGFPKSESGTSETCLTNFQSPYSEQIKSEIYQIKTCFDDFVYPCRITKY